MSVAFHKALDGVRDEFIAHPLRFFSEYDMHWYFCVLLEREIQSCLPPNEDSLLQTKVSRGLKTMLVHQEYGTTLGKGESFDVCLLGPVQLANADSDRFKVIGKYAAPLEIVEFTDRHAARRVDLLGDKLYKDAEKLRQEGRGHRHVEAFLRTTLSRSRLWISRAIPSLQKSLARISDMQDVEASCTVVDIPSGVVLTWDAEKHGFLESEWRGS